VARSVRLSVSSSEEATLTHHTDPGWRPALRDVWWMLVPFAGPLMRVRARRRGTPGLLAMRSVFVGLIASLILFLVVLNFIERFDGGDEGPVPVAVLALGVLSLIGTLLVSRRRLSTSSAQALASAYRASFFIEIGVAEAAALFGFAGVFITGSVWVYLIGLAFTFVGFGIAAPSRADIERRQREITASGSSLSLLDALMQPPQPPQRPR
jgi:hypothetical protein